MSRVLQWHNKKSYCDLKGNIPSLCDSPQKKKGGKAKERMKGENRELKDIVVYLSKRDYIC